VLLRERESCGEDEGGRIYYRGVCRKAGAGWFYGLLSNSRIPTNLPGPSRGYRQHHPATRRFQNYCQSLEIGRVASIGPDESFLALICSSEANLGDIFRCSNFERLPWMSSRSDGGAVRLYVQGTFFTAYLECAYRLPVLDILSIRNRDPVTPPSTGQKLLPSRHRLLINAPLLRMCRMIQSQGTIRQIITPKHANG
jgi:hypothetical protein